MKHISRREFVALTVAGTAAGAVTSPFARELNPFAAITANDIVERIRKNIGVDWKADSVVDTFKAGDPSTVVSGVVVTSMATLDVLQQAAKAGANFVISGGPTFYSRADGQPPQGRGFGAGAGGRAGGGGRGAAPAYAPGQNPTALESGPSTGASSPMPPPPAVMPPSVLPPRPARGGGGGRAGAPAGAAAGDGGAPPPAPPVDPVVAGKRAYIDKNKLVIFRLNESWMGRKPDPRAVGLATLMGWTRYKIGDDALRYEIPAMTLDTLASLVKKNLGIRGGIRAIGDPTNRVTKVGLLPGYTQIQATLALLPNVDLVIAGEVQEWESAAYAQDVAYAGVKKGFISVGRLVSEAPAMQVCADWLKTIVPEVPVKFISAGDPYWRPL
jgi:putative NIF3 family GTP cyclohydrolase 1 type 2